MAAAISLLSPLGYRVVASTGLVAPFILRNVTLAGIDSVNTPREVRVEAWARLARDLDPGKLKSTESEIGLADVPNVAAKILKGQVRGRTVVNVNG